MTQGHQLDILGIVHFGEAAHPILAHADFGAPDCCGCLFPKLLGDQSEITCNECGAVVRTVATADLQRTLDEMELSLDMCSAMCPYCGKVNFFPGFAKMTAYTCWECGESVVIRDS